MKKTFIMTAASLAFTTLNLEYAAAQNNTIQVNSAYSFIGSGSYNTIQPYAGDSVIGGGVDNEVQTNSPYACIGGGYSNIIQPYSAAGFIGGGEDNYIQPTADASFIGGGLVNSIQSYSYDSFIGGGTFNTIQYNCSPSVIVGGSGNTIQTNSYYASIGGGDGNYIEPDSSYSVIGGAEDNTIGNGSPYSVIGGGDVNIIQPGSPCSVIVGGAGNIVGPNAGNSLAAGSYAEVLHAGSFVWSDASSSGNTTSFAANSWTVRATGGSRFITAVSGSGTPTAGVSLAAGSGTWTSLSDRNAKEHFADVDAKTILAKVAALPVLTWNYKTQDASIRHIGPMAQDFKAAFKVGESDTGITTVDEEGVALAAIQGLNQKLNDKDAEIRQLQESVEQLKQLIQSLNGKK